MSVEDQDTSSARNRLMIAVRVVVSVVLLAILLSRVDRAALWSSMRQASIAWLAVALAIYFVHILTGAWRWRLLLGAQNVYVPQRDLLSSLLVAYFFNNFLPSNIGGDVVRISDTARPARSRTLATLVILADRVLGVIGLFLVAAVASTIAFETRGSAGAPILPVWLWAILIAATAVVVPVVASPEHMGRLLTPADASASGMGRIAHRHAHADAAPISRSTHYPGDVLHGRGSRPIVAGRATTLRSCTP